MGATVESNIVAEYIRQAKLIAQENSALDDRMTSEPITLYRRDDLVFPVNRLWGRVVIEKFFTVQAVERYFEIQRRICVERIAQILDSDE